MATDGGTLQIIWFQTSSCEGKTVGLFIAIFLAESIFKMLLLFFLIHLQKEYYFIFFCY